MASPAAAMDSAPGDVEIGGENPEAAAAAAGSAENPGSGLQNLGFPGLSFEDSSATVAASSLPDSVESSLQQSGAAFAYESVDTSPDRGTAVPAACAVNSAYFDELITTEARSSPADGTQSASAALKRNAATLEQPARQQPAARLADEKRVLRKRRPAVEAHVEAVKIPPLEEIQRMLEEQKKAFDGQLADLGRLLEVQVRLTGVNPLFQELSSSVLGTKAVKKPDEALSQDTLQSLREVYALKDTLTKKEVRDLSLQTGATRTQIREFIQGQQARVKRMMHQLALEGAGRVDVTNAVEHSQFFPTNMSGITNLSTSDSVDKLVESMRSENSFTGQSNILQFILQADYVPGLRLLLDRGGLRFLSKWLNQAVVEDQTSLIRLILKALFHLPMIHAVPAQVSPLVQTMSRLRSYFSTDVSTKARILIAKWSKLFARTGVGKMLGQAAEPKKIDAGVLGGQDLARQLSSSGHLHAVAGPEKKKLKTEANTDYKPDALKPQNKAVLAQPNLKGLHMSERPSASGNLRRSLQTIEDPALASEATKKRLAEHGKEKRRVVLVEEISATNRRRDAESRRSSGMEKGSRPLSADEIRKAKMRERLLQGSTPKDSPARPKESAPTTSSRSSVTSQPEHAGASNSHFQAAHTLHSRQDAVQPPAYVREGQHDSQPAPNSSLNRPAADSHRTFRPPPEQSYRPRESLSVPRLQPEPTSSHFQPAHAVPRQDSAPPPPVSLPAPFFNMVHQASVAYHPQLPVQQALRSDTPDQMQQHQATGVQQQNQPLASESPKSPSSEPEKTAVDVEVEDKLVAEAEGEHPLDSPAKVLIGDLLKRLIPWCIPSAAYVDPNWSVAVGEESKEKEFQSSRVKREVEEFYSDPDTIPQNPKDPWDEEQDYDDSLTPEVPLESVDEKEEERKGSSQAAQPVHVQPANAAVPSHDPELLALLLKNPALVSELTSGKGLQGLQSLQGLKSDSNQQPAPNQMYGIQRAGEVYGQQQQQYYGNSGGYNPSSAAGQWNNGAEMFNQQRQQQQQQYYNYKGGNGGNPTQVWNQRVSNNNVSFGHGNTNQGMEMGLRPSHHHHPPPNNVVAQNDRYHLPPSHHQQQQQQQQQQHWYNTSLHRPPRPGGW